MTKPKAGTRAAGGKTRGPAAASASRASAPGKAARGEGLPDPPIPDPAEASRQMAEHMAEIARKSQRLVSDFLSRLGGPNPSIVGDIAARDVEITTVDAYCARSGAAPDWLMIDVEGYEFDVLAGAAETIRRCRPGIIVELHPQLYPAGAATQEAGAQLLRQLGLRPVPVGDEGRDPWAVGAVSLEPV